MARLAGKRKVVEDSAPANRESLGTPNVPRKDAANIVRSQGHSGPESGFTLKKERMENYWKPTSGNAFNKRQLQQLYAQICVSERFRIQGFNVKNKVPNRLLKSAGCSLHSGRGLGIVCSLLKDAFSENHKWLHELGQNSAVVPGQD
eukprot:TRINITY_DN786_c0_g1_i1.p1 TRINITY_DN786_c0_g1~~TRINITY_DN786_c0_g1_i1.p1  ORF type:complete len:147 (+),score=3.66 TRINITY_DN786_c0_g1_i1:166-606(+)